MTTVPSAAPVNPRTAEADVRVVAGLDSRPGLPAASVSRPRTVDRVPLLADHAPRFIGGLLRGDRLELAPRVVTLAQRRDRRAPISARACRNAGRTISTRSSAITAWPGARTRARQAELVVEVGVARVIADPGFERARTRSSVWPSAIMRRPPPATAPAGWPGPRATRRPRRPARGRATSCRALRSACATTPGADRADRPGSAMRSPIRTAAGKSARPGSLAQPASCAAHHDFAAQ